MGKTQYTWDKDTQIAKCIINYNNTQFIGIAQCHPDDNDMSNKLTGQTIAEFRAVIQVLKYKRDCEIVPQLKALKQLYYSINKSKYYNKKSYEARMLYRHINMLEEDLKAIREEIKSLKDSLKFYLDAKETYYQAVRRKRTAKSD